MKEYSAEDLLSLGFIDIADWVLEQEYLNFRLRQDLAGVASALLAEPNALYAFVNGDEILYIGKTTRSLRKRLANYRRPGSSQRTNLKCNAKLRELIELGHQPRILGFVPVSHLRYGDFEVNLAAGLEDSLIREINPAWNGSENGTMFTETAQREIDDEVGGEIPEEDTQSSSQRREYDFVLQQTYYQKGIVNTGVDASRFLGSDGEPILVEFGDGSPPVSSKINRTANRSGGVRLVGNNRLISDWFQSNFFEGETITLEIIDENKIRLKGK